MTRRRMERRSRKQLSLLVLLHSFHAILAYVPASRSPLFLPSRATRRNFCLSATSSDEPIPKRSLKKIKTNVSSALSKRFGKSKKLKPGGSRSFQSFRLKQENELLRETVRQLEKENERLKEGSSKVIIESFEREGRPNVVDVAWYETEEGGGPASMDTEGITMSGVELESSALWCDELDDGVCPVEPTVSFIDAMKDRAYWLVGLLVLQSCSGFILSRNEALLESHPVIIYFLTMLVGAGGNAGNQSSVRVIRGLALGTLNERTQAQFLWRELRMAGVLSVILSLTGFLRAVAFATPMPETIAVTSALTLIVFSSICLGAVLPLLLKKIGVDPAHSSTTIQVVMDILGVVMTVVVSTAVLDSPIGKELVAKLIGSS